MAIQSTFVPDPSRSVPINPELRCGEEWTSCVHDDGDCERDDGYDDDDFRHPSPITFHVTLPAMLDDGYDDDIRRDPVKLNFNARDRSSGVLLPSEPTATTSGKTSNDDDDGDDDNDNVGDPYFFEKGFYLEAKTGFQPWPGSRLMLEAFACGMNNNDSRMGYWRTRLTKSDVPEGLRILEVGAGVGIVGTCLAAMGGNVLITDLAVLVEHGILPNLRRNDRRHRRRRGRRLNIGKGDAREDEPDIDRPPPPPRDARRPSHRKWMGPSRRPRLARARLGAVTARNVVRVRRHNRVRLHVDAQAHRSAVHGNNDVIRSMQVE